MPATVNVIVTCAKRKTRIPTPDCMLRSVTGRTIETRGEEWLARLRRTPAERLAAEDLYSGEHWKVGRSLAGMVLGSGHRVRLWICSAGYGLLTPASRVSAYAATFAAGQPDSVGHGLGSVEPRAARRVWWKLLCDWEGPEPVGPRSVAQLARAEPRSLLLVVVSEVYLGALADDLREAVRHLADPELLSVLCAGAGLESAPADSLLPCDARLQPQVGGARHTLNVRIARAVLTQLRREPPTRSVLRAHLARMLAGQPQTETNHRVTLTDGDVQDYIVAALGKDPRHRPTPLLQRLRAEGCACEQARFVSLFHQVRKQLHES